MPSQIDGQNFPCEPATTEWERQRLGIRGDRRGFYSGFRKVTASFGLLESDDYNFFYGRYLTGSHITLTLLREDKLEYATYSGCVIDEVQGVDSGFSDYYDNVRVVFDVPVD